LSEIASVIGARIGRLGLREAFIHAVQRSPGCTPGVNELLISEARKKRHGSWEDVYNLLFSRVRKAQVGHDLIGGRRRGEGTRPWTPSPNPARARTRALHHLEADEDDGSDMGSSEDEEGDEEVGLAAFSLEQHRELVASRCRVCAQKGHFAAECPQRDSKEITVPTELMQDLLQAATAQSRMVVRKDATGQRRLPRADRR